MSVEEQEDQMMEMAYQSLKIRQQNTTTYIKPRGQTEETAFDSFDPNDCSFQRAIHQENMDVLKNAASRFLEESLEADFDRELGFRDPELYQNLPFEVGGTQEMEALAGHNELLSQREQQELLGWLRREEELVGLLREAVPVFGITVGKEVVFGVYHLLRVKLEEFKTVRDPKPTILPRFDCFFGFEEQTTFNNSCPVYEDINLQEVAAFAEKDLEDISSMLYFSCQVKYLNLREALPETKSHLRPKFHSLIKQLSRTIFFTLAGAVDTASLSGCSLPLDLSRQASFADFSEGSMLAIRKSLSRPFVPCEEDPVSDFLSKRRKFQQ